MKKLAVTLMMSFMLFNVMFDIPGWLQDLFPKYDGDLSKVEYKVIAQDLDGTKVVEIGGVIYIVKDK